MSNLFYDVIVVGAGPAGSWAAWELASLGYRIAVLEQKPAPGLDICCTGIISTRCFDSFGIALEAILTRAHSASFFSPSGRCFRVESANTQAYVVDRPAFDRAVAKKASASGATYFFSSRVTDIAIGDEGARVEILCGGSREAFGARAVLLASGYRPRLTEKLGLGTIRRFLTGAQAEVEAHGVREAEVYLTQQLAPGSFAWLVPGSENRALAGVLARHDAGSLLKHFLLGHFHRGRIADPGTQITQKPVPLGTLPYTYGDRILVVGDAAGQVKPTTGGGIYFGHLGARIAAKVLGEALRSDNLASANLSRYQQEWIQRIGGEIRLGYWARQVYARLSDRHVERLFGALDSGGLAQAVVDSPGFSFDWHSRLLLAGSKYALAYPWRKAWRTVSREGDS